MRTGSVVLPLLGFLSAVAVTVAGALGANDARAAVQEPNGQVVPTAPGCAGGTKPSGLLAAFACACTQPGVCNIGAPCTSQTTCDDGKHGTCESTMWHAFNDNTCIPSQASGLDPVAEASLVPETFHPTCALTFTVVTRGTAIFKDVFGWYNVTGAAPQLADLHPMLGCADGAGTSVVLDIQKEPAYAGGDIGFFLLTPEGHGTHAQCAGGDCCPTIARAEGGAGYAYFSERKYNPDSAAASAFIHLLVYNSHIVSRKFYFAWEDSFQGTNGDFTDVVTSVEGIECSGGGEDCDTGQKGICARGVTKCAASGVGCSAIFAPKPEVCDGLDDDCDGIVDNGAVCPDPKEVCQNGACVHRCTNNEFKCWTGTACDDKTELCVDPSCIGVTCPADAVCRSGSCAKACDGIVCPHGQTCANDACVDLCKGVACAAGQVCRDGACFAGCAACDGIVCASSLKCDGASGDCVDPSCPTPCAAGTFCKAGACVDACDGAKCPHGGTCQNGACVGGGATTPAPDGGLAVGNDVDAGGGGGGGGADGGGGPNDVPPSWDAHHGCACGVAAPAGGGALGALAGLGAIGAAFGRRRRARR